MTIHEMAIKTLLGTTGILLLLRFLIVLFGSVHIESSSRAACHKTRVSRSNYLRRMAGMTAAILLIVPLLYSQQEQAPAPASAQEVQELRQLVRDLQTKVASLESQIQTQPPSAGATGSASSDPPPAAGTPAATALLSPDERGVLDFFRGTTINLGLDGYYGYNFNQPVGRINLLRAYDVSSNSFSLNQANLIIERAPDVSAGNRFGIRLDLQFGQATESAQGNPGNELRPQAYRPLWQAYGTYVLPLGKGLTVDFGKWASSLGLEGNYTKDQINYSRSYFFNFLPYYHTGVRATYQFNNFASLTYGVVNGVGQAEDFNGFKSQLMFLSLHPTKTVSWNINYYGGQEQRDVVPVLNPGFPTLPSQPGLPVTPVVPTPNGWFHVFDSYATWTPTSKLTLVAEGDYVINRAFSHSAPTHVAGGAAYARYQLTPKAALAARAEYLSDRGGLFSGTTQALKETTLTYEYKFVDGFLVRTEWRRDFSNQPFFLSDQAGSLKKSQNTATIGLVWWMGRKQGGW